MKCFSFTAYLLALSVLISLVLSPISYSQQALSSEEVEALVEDLYLQEASKLDQQQVVVAVRNSLKNRHSVSPLTRIKAHILLIRLANNRGDFASASEFAGSGLLLPNLPDQYSALFHLQLAKGYYVQGQFEKTLREASTAASFLSEYQESQAPLYIEALSYQAMAHSLMGQVEQADEYFDALQDALVKNPSAQDDETVIAIIAKANFYQGDYQSAINLYEKLLTIKFTEQKTANIDEYYYELGRSYIQLGNYDDAYSAFWEAKLHAETNKSNIRMAFAYLGLGSVLLNMEDNQQAYNYLIMARDLFKGQNQTRGYLSTLIYLSQAAQRLGKPNERKNALNDAQRMSTSMQLSAEQINLYLLLARNAIAEGKMQLAVNFYEQYINSYKTYYTTRSGAASFAEQSALKQQSQLIAQNLLEKNELKQTFAIEMNQRKQVIAVLIACLLIVLCLCFVAYVKYRQVKRRLSNVNYRGMEQFWFDTAKTKNLYQKYYNMARKFDFPLSICLVSIENWQEFKFRFSQKSQQEFNEKIAEIFTEYLEEFDLSGNFSSGRFLIIFPHQQPQDVVAKLKKLVTAVEVRYFTSLGGFQISVDYQCDTPEVQDIDPFIFLTELEQSLEEKIAKGHAFTI
ncbi:tetratricopeptide repeat protein [Thalassotalea agarivorans]|nr:hypothetical protein [Thalassotalea agarivorans]